MAGRALLVTTLVLVFSFGIQVFSRVTGVATFGVLASFAKAVAFIADLTLSPALLALAFDSSSARHRNAADSEPSHFNLYRIGRRFTPPTSAE